MDLIEFLKVRLDEDEAIAKAVRPDQDYSDSAHQDRWTPGRVLREVAVKRRIIDELIPVLDAMELQLEVEGQAPLMPGHGEHGDGQCDGPHHMPDNYARDLLLSLLAKAWRT